jgi:hypothetical protein
LQKVQRAQTHARAPLQRVPPLRAQDGPPLP